jgi:hypothetical protein
VVFTGAPAGGLTAQGTATITSTMKVNSITGSGGCYNPTTGVTVATLSGGGPIPHAVAPTLTVNFGAGVTGCNSTTKKPISSISISGGNSGYTSTPSITVSGANAPPPLSTANMSRADQGGQRHHGHELGLWLYQHPTITLSGGGGTGAAYTAVMSPSNRISTISLTNNGVGYSGAPTITFGNVGAGTGAAATASMTSTNSVIGINITNGGSGYTSLPTITLSGTPASPATLVPVLGSTNVISSVSVTNSGSGYLSTPTLVLSPLSGAAPGSGATFSYTYNTIINQPPTMTWTGIGTPTTAIDYFTLDNPPGNPAGYIPDAGSPMAAGATLLTYPNVANSSTANYPKFKNRTDCTGATSCTWAEERQNYANWDLYHSNRLDLAKTGIGLAFQPLNPTFRLGWGKINSLDDSTGATSKLDKGVRLYDSGVQKDFLDWLYGIKETDLIAGTPNRVALDQVGTLFQADG